MTVKFADRIIATTAPRYGTVFGPKATATPALTIYDLCVQAGIPEQPNGKLPIKALDAALKLCNWDIEKRMIYKENARRVGLID